MDRGLRPGSLVKKYHIQVVGQGIHQGCVRNIDLIRQRVVRTGNAQGERAARVSF